MSRRPAQRSLSKRGPELRSLRQLRYSPWGNRSPLAHSPSAKSGCKRIPRHGRRRNPESPANLAVAEQGIFAERDHTFTIPLGEFLLLTRAPSSHAMPESESFSLQIVDPELLRDFGIRFSAVPDRLKQRLLLRGSETDTEVCPVAVDAVIAGDSADTVGMDEPIRSDLVIGLLGSFQDSDKRGHLRFSQPPPTRAVLCLQFRRPLSSLPHALDQAGAVPWDQRRRSSCPRYPLCFAGHGLLQGGREVEVLPQPPQRRRQ